MADKDTSRAARRAQRAAERISQLRDTVTEARKAEARANVGWQSARERKTVHAEIRAAQREYVRAREKLLHAELAEVRALGLYEPKTERGQRPKLTKSRRAAIRKAWETADNYSRGSAFAPIVGLSKKQRKEIARGAAEAGARVTRSGVFMPRAEREINQPVGYLKKDKTGFWRVVVQKQSKPDATGKRHTITHEHYLAGTDALEHAEKRLNDVFGRMRYDPKKERIRFVVQGGNVSHRSFRNMGELLAYARAYRKTHGSMAGFLDSLTIVKFRKDSGRQWRVPVGKIDTLGRTRAIKPTELNWGPNSKRKRRGWSRGKSGE